MVLLDEGEVREVGTFDKLMDEDREFASMYNNAINNPEGRSPAARANNPNKSFQGYSFRQTQHSHCQSPTAAEMLCI